MTWLHAVGAAAPAVALAVAASGAHAFPLLYLASPWSISAVGRDTMVFSVAMAALLDLSLAVRVFGLDDLPRQVLSVVAYSVLAVLFWRRVLLLWRLQRDPSAFADADAARRARRAARRAQPNPRTEP